MDIQSLEKFCNNETKYSLFKHKEMFYPNIFLNAETFVNFIEETDIILTTGTLIEPMTFHSNSGFSIGELVGCMYTLLKDKYDDTLRYAYFEGFKVFKNKIDNKIVVQILIDN